jgi:hypothetical protein
VWLFGEVVHKGRCSLMGLERLRRLALFHQVADQEICRSKTFRGFSIAWFR